MEEKINRKLNWYYYGVMVFTLIILSVMYYLASQEDFEPINPMESVGMTLQYIAIGVTLVAIPFGLYLVKFRKPQTLEQYEQVATGRILIVGLTMPMNIAFFYLLGAHRPMLWLAAIAAIAWYFTKPTLGKMEQEMKPEDPNEEKY
ncbi:MAG: hypothetical protein IJS82_02035 [Paludibacteraceae bacterium]|nr:hypothetical protein [Paludibacteraceae bacterium]